MNLLRPIRRFLRALLSRKRLECELDEELRAHIDSQIGENISAGMKPAEARQKAMREFGGIESTKERCREERPSFWMEELARDFRFGLRALAKNPGFTTVAIATLALGIGANTAVFQLLNAIRLKTLPVTRPQELIEVRFINRPGMGVFDSLNSEMTYPLWEQVRRQHEPLSGAFAWGNSSLPLGRGAQSREANVLWFSGEAFSVLGLRPELGQFFGPADDRRGAGPNGIVISDSFWRREFGGAENVIGKTLDVGDRVFQVIGVTAPGFFGLEIGQHFDFILPTSLRELWWPNLLDRTDAWWLRMMGRLKPDWTLARANDYIKTIAPAVLETTAPAGYASGAAERYRSSKLNMQRAANGVSRLRTDYEKSLWLLLGITGLVLLIACLNLANLTLARANSRGREIAVRVALGASRLRLIKQVLCENLLLAFTGGVLGAILAKTLSIAIARFLSGSNGASDLDLSLDWRVFLFTAAVTAFTCIIFGTAPALRSSKIQPQAALQSGGRGTTMGRDRLLLQRGLAIVQVAVSLVLLFGAFLLIQTFRNLVTLDPGFRQEGILYAYLGFGDNHAGERAVFRKQLIEKIEALPQVQSAALTSHVPLGGSSWTMGVRLNAPTPTEDIWSKVTWISPNYFKALAMPLVNGREFTIRDDDEKSAPVAIVNETFVRKYLPNVNPIGLTLRTIAEPGYPEAAYEIVGVVKDTKYGDLRGEIPPITFAPDAHHPISGAFAAMIIRVSGEPGPTLAAVKRELESIDPSMRMTVQILTKTVRERLARERLMAWLSGFFGLIALLLVVVGLYGLTSYLTLLRRNEIGVRLALGAQKTRILWLIFRQGIVLTATGVAVGALGALALGTSLKSLLFGVAPGDLGTLVSISIILIVVAGLAAWLPARRAARLDPMIALRCE